MASSFPAAAVLTSPLSDNTRGITPPLLPLAGRRSSRPPRLMAASAFRPQLPPSHAQVRQTGCCGRGPSLVCRRKSAECHEWLQTDERVPKKGRGPAPTERSLSSRPLPCPTSRAATLALGTTKRPPTPFLMFPMIGPQLRHPRCCAFSHLMGRIGVPCIPAWSVWLAWLAILAGGMVSS